MCQGLRQARHAKYMALPFISRMIYPLLHAIRALLDNIRNATILAKLLAKALVNQHARTYARVHASNHAKAPAKPGARIAAWLRVSRTAGTSAKQGARWLVGPPVKARPRVAVVVCAPVRL